ncbi:MAG: dihydropteroate synthase [Syntrophobacterales bacterium]|jgi:5-methyltetrahydrofolate--homocysteine methyltransferase
MIVIAEKINGTLPMVKTVIQNRDQAALLNLAKEQAAAGASYIDVNVGTGIGSREDEIQAMEWAVESIQREVETPLCIDSADPAVLESGLKSRNGRPSLINSAKAEKQSLEEVVPLASTYGAPLIALTMDESGIPKTVDDRLQAAEKVVTACERLGVPIEDIFFDLLVMPISTDVKQGLKTLAAITEVKKQFPGCKTVLGISNISYGLPARGRLNAAFLCMAVYAGLDAAIIDPVEDEISAAVKTAEVLAGRDRHCRKYTRAFRK